MPHEPQPPIVILWTGRNKNKRTFKLHLKEHRGRGRMVEVQVDKAESKEAAIALLAERSAAQGWKPGDCELIRNKAIGLLRDVPWPASDEWLRANKGEKRL